MTTTETQAVKPSQIAVRNITRGHYGKYHFAFKGADGRVSPPICGVRSLSGRFAEAKEHLLPELTNSNWCKKCLAGRA